jgi:hypothetical protein
VKAWPGEKMVSLSLFKAPDATITDEKRKALLQLRTMKFYT